MINEPLPPTYPGFPYQATELAKYICNVGTFTICLKQSRVLIRFEPQQPDEFQQWLDRHGVLNIGAVKTFRLS